MELLKQKTLLYAEDELDIQKQYTQYFQNYFKYVFSVANGQEALSIYNKQKPDVLILDINMPQLNGLEVAKRIREQDSDINIILLTAKSDKETLKKAIELELTTYLEKPISRAALKEALKKLNNKMHKKTIKKLWLYENDYYVWDTEKQELTYKKQQIALTKQEMLLLNLFVRQNGIKTNYQDIYEVVWFDSDKEYKEANIKTLISALRIKLPPKAIQNVYGVGYFLNIY